MTPRSQNPVQERSFVAWCQKAGLRSHDLRRSYATHFMYITNKDLPLVKIARGQS